MADNLVFPIGFDLEEAVKKAGQEWNSTYADKLEKLLAKRAITVNLGFSTKNLNNLDDVKRRLAELKIEPLTPENKTAIKDLVRELKELAKAMEKVQKYSKIQTPELQQALANKANAEAAHMAEKYRQANERLEVSKRRVALAEQKHAEALSNTSKKINEQHSYVSRLIKRMAVYASFAAFGNFLTNVREVTAQFELQRVSLGAILQDANKGAQIFSQIKQFALKSPISILDLTKYTKQLAAYKIGYDELFDTTKRLADISVGLGVDFQRLTLLYGQVRARGALFSSEIRQATEAGIPLVELLAKKYSELNGQLVTASQVLKMVEKGMVGFEMVEEIFKDMTSAGGMFYEMQEKQGNTLYGLWAKLGDAASVMYEQIGNTETVGKGMRSAIQALTDLMRNWQMVPRMMATVGLATLVYITRQKILKLETAKVAAIQETYNARMAQTHMLLSSSSRLTRAHGFALGVQARMLKMASTAAAAFGTSLTAIKSAIISTGWGALILALGYVADKLLFAKTNAEKAAEAISKISEETATETAKSVRNFEDLANKTVNAPKGSKEQKEALEELNRTYGDILPKELLELEYLDKLNGKYGSLTNTIREYIAEQQRRKALDEITNVYGAEKQKYERELTNYFREQGWTEGEIARFWEKFYDVAKDKSKGLQQVVAESVKFAGREGFEDVFNLLQHQSWQSKVDKYTSNKTGLATFGGWLGGGIDNIDLLRDVVLEENQAIEQNIERHKAAATTTDEFADAQEKAAKRLKEVRLFDTKGESIDSDSYLGGQALANFEIKDMTNILKDGFAQAGLVWDAEYGNFIEHINTKTPELISSLNFDAIIDAIINALNNPDLTEAQRQFLENLLSVAQQSKKRYEEIVPADPIVRVAQTRFKQIAQSAGGFREQYNQYLMKAGEDMKSYNKRLKDEVEDLKNRVKALLHTQKVIAKAGIFAKMLYGVSAEELQKDIDETNKTISIIEKTLSEQPDNSQSTNTGTKSDPRLQNLKEEISLTKKLYDEYHKLEKQIGATKAAEKIQQIYSNTIKTLQDRAGKYGFTFKLPFTDENLKSNMQHFIDKMKELQKLHDKKGNPLFPNIGNEIDEAVAQLADVDLNSLQKALEKKLKSLSDRISRTKTAKEFYEKILGMTGDVELAANVSLQIYGSTGKELSEQVKEQFRLAFATLDKPDVEVSAKIGDLIDKGRYEELRDYIALLPEAQRKAAEDLVKAQQQMSVKQYEQWLKDLEKAKDYADKRIELSRYTANQIAEIEERIAKLDPAASDYEQQKAMLEKLIAGYKSREDKMGSELEYEQFKNSALYVQVFENLDNASKTALENMRNRLLALKDQWKNLSPEKVKELTRRLEELDAQIAQRNPFKSIADSIKKLREMRMSGRTKEGDAQKAFDAEADRKAAEAKMLADEKAYEAAVKQYGAESDIAKAKRKIADDSAEAYRNAKKMADSAAENADEWGIGAEAIYAANQKLDKYQSQVNEALDDVRKIMGSFGASAEDIQFFDDVTNGFNEIFDAGQQGAEAYASFMMGDFVGAAKKGISAVGSLISGVSNLFYAGRVKRANEEIKRQQKLLDQLEYAYGRLEKAADKVFGADYVANQKQQQKILLAQQQAYMKQYEAEMSKGKKADKEKAQEFLDKARDVGDQIADMQGKIAEQMLGTDLTSAARDFAKAWLDAYKQFGNTADAMSEKFHEMIENMVVESLMAKAMQRALEPAFKMIDEMDEGDFYSEDFWRKVMETADQGSKDANAAGAVIMEWAKKWGYDGREKAEGFTGIAKSVAGATSEEINNVAAIGNTLMYYVSPIPRIDENLARVVALMEGRTAALPTASGVTSGAVDYTDLFNTANQHLSSLPRMEQHLAEIHTMLGRALRTKGSTTGFNTFLNS